MRRKEQMNVIRHNHPGVKVTAFATILDRTSDHYGNLAPFKMDWPKSGSVEQSVHRDKRLPRGQTLLRKLASNRQAAIKAKCHEKRLSDGIEMRETAL